MDVIQRLRIARIFPRSDHDLTFDLLHMVLSHGDLPTATQLIKDEISVEMGIRERIVQVLESRIAWAEALKESLLAPGMLTGSFTRVENSQL